MDDVVLRADDLSVRYRSRDIWSRHIALAGLNLEVFEGEFLGVVGETGAGKSTLAATFGLQADRKTLGSRRPEICGGSLEIFGEQIRGIGFRARSLLGLKVGYLSQDAALRLDSRLTVAENVAEPIFSRDRKFSQREAGMAVATLIDLVRLPLSFMEKFPYELSSGQRQRVAIARSLILEPSLYVADEPTRGVDVSVRSGILEMLGDLKSERSFTAVIVSSDLQVIADLADRVLVLQEGRTIGLDPFNGVSEDANQPFLKALDDVRLGKVDA